MSLDDESHGLVISCNLWVFKQHQVSFLDVWPFCDFEEWRDTLSSISPRRHLPNVGHVSIVGDADLHVQKILAEEEAYKSFASISALE